MTIVGASDFRQQTVRVSSVGRIFGEGWVKVSEFDPARWNPPDAGGGTANVYIVAWADVGGVSIARNDNPFATIDVALGLSRGPWEIDFEQQAKVGLDAPPRVEASKGAPWFFVWSRTASSGGVWPLAAGDVPAMWARISTNGRPTTETEAEFAVSNVGWLVFYVDELDGRVHFARERLASPVRMSDSTGASQSTLLDTGALGSSVLTGSGTYLGFASVELSTMTDGQFPLQGPRLWCEHVDVSAGTTNRVLGRDTRWGMLHAGTLLRRDLLRYRLGTFFLVDAPADGDSFRLRGIDTHSALLWRADYFGAELLLIHVGNLGSFAGLQIESRTDSLARIFNDPDVPALSRLALEQTRGFHQDVTAIGTGAFWFDGVNLVHRLEIGLAGRSRARSDLYANTLSTREGVHLHVGRVDRGLGSSAFRHELLATSPPWYSGQQIARAGTDIALAAWSWENDPNYVPTPIPEAPSTTWLVPGRESLDAGSLAALPTSPAREVSARETLDVATIESLDPVRPRWPLYLGARRRFDIAWPALSRSERATLQAFLAANRVFALTLEVEGETIAVVAGELAVVDIAAAQYSATLSVVELVWTGGA